MKKAHSYSLSPSTIKLVKRLTNKLKLTSDSRTVEVAILKLNEYLTKQEETNGKAES